ncbi:hypothetical protein ADL01_14960 [Streptomyces sp. NRRL WC-3618]|uniref:hypothetical protein n=1 Tax=Streptomyces sp. NRRL WC-3618 TaxID=1519490 RepID=UPI0006AE746C|nr:hypothetical protein [Streptomyces sp. NRRL WC-3618]KOV78622.1 hypothetical protein ADL01_14960 [Streptomyces sp. NRRL WC-3618]
MHRATSRTVRARRQSSLRRRTQIGATPRRSFGHNLAPWATALSAVAAAIGLFFSATVASSSVDATRKQLERDRRQQAGRVSYWTEDASGMSETVIVANRSLDPVTRVDLWFYAPDAGVDGYEWVFMGFDAIPPCTRLTFAPRAIDDFLKGYGIAQGGAPIRAVQFFDSDGQQWLRDPDGLRAAENERKDGEDVGVAPARQEPAEHCDK